MDDKSDDMTDKLKKAKTVKDVAAAANMPFLTAEWGYRIQPPEVKTVDAKEGKRSWGAAAKVTRANGELLDEFTFYALSTHAVPNEWTKGNVTGDDDNAAKLLFFSVDVNRSLGDIPVIHDFLRGHLDEVKVGHLTLLVTTITLSEETVKKVEPVCKKLFTTPPTLPVVEPNDPIKPGVYVTASYKVADREGSLLRVDLPRSQMEETPHA
ncbi:hypothetical protein H8N00_07605 [Streptomyces sp. AC563]|uniref:hypothetical protein n=1 Tax=Streptomyces buecherae TaxID=2763006 RepID=UPI00164CEE13|nr:hypothetical protein [Streptomyces buecherae]MBC3988754.1 hypothetical protein [Streptomyces buecherae]